jgi:hypothetical protein
MVVGFNHNIMYKGELFHIQTEDSGITNPHIITLLYRGGTIIASKKTSYADIIKVENLEQVVEELMKDQHKDLLRRLKSGEFDERAFGRPTAATAEAAGAKNPAPFTAIEPPGKKAATVPPPAPDNPPRPAAGGIPKPQQSLDEIILDYLVAGDDK